MIWRPNKATKRIVDVNVNCTYQHLHKLFNILFDIDQKENRLSYFIEVSKYQLKLKLSTGKLS